MSGQGKRLDRMLPLLTVKERAVMTLHDYKAGKPQDLALLNSTTDKQVAEFNRYIGMMNAANSGLAHAIDVIRERARQEELRYYWLESQRIAALEMWGVRAAMAMSAREPITETAYRKREAEARKELIPIDECAMLYTEYHHAWDDADYEVDEEGSQQPSDEAWYRVRDAKLAAMREAVAAGTLEATGKGKRMKIESGSFHDWIGEPTPVPPDLGIEYDVRPDERWREVERERKDHVFIKQVLDRGACRFDLPLDMKSPLVLERDVTGFDVEMARLVAVGLRAAVRENWCELQAIEGKLDEMSDEFAGEDVLHPTVRVRFDEAKALLTELHEKVQEYTGPFDLPEPDDDLMQSVERIVEREIAHVPRR
jgi:hypothetical protein